MTSPSNTEIRDIVNDAINNPDDPVYGFTTKGAVAYLTILLDRLEASEARLTAEAELNGLARKSLCKELEAAEAKLKAVNGCVRYQTIVEINGKHTKVNCLLLDHIKEATK